MRLTAQQLRRIIKEEVDNAILSEAGWTDFYQPPDQKKIDAIIAQGPEAIKKELVTIAEALANMFGKASELLFKGDSFNFRNASLRGDQLIAAAEKLDAALKQQSGQQAPVTSSTMKMPAPKRAPARRR